MVNVHCPPTTLKMSLILQPFSYQICVAGQKSKGCQLLTADLSSNYKVKSLCFLVSLTIERFKRFGDDNKRTAKLVL